MSAASVVSVAYWGEKSRPRVFFLKKKLKKIKKKKKKKYFIFFFFTNKKKINILIFI
jgi:hypothetical protein